MSYINEDEGQRIWGNPEEESGSYEPPKKAAPTKRGTPGTNVAKTGKEQAEKLLSGNPEKAAEAVTGKGRKSRKTKRRSTKKRRSTRRRRSA